MNSASSEPAKTLLQVLFEREQECLAAGKVPRSDLELLVFVAYDVAAITEGRAMRLLQLDRVELRKQYQDWLARRPRYIQGNIDSVQTHEAP